MTKPFEDAKSLKGFAILPTDLIQTLIQKLLYSLYEICIIVVKELDTGSSKPTSNVQITFCYQSLFSSDWRIS